MKLILKFFVFLLALLVGFIGCSGEDLKAPGGSNSSLGGSGSIIPASDLIISEYFEPDFGNHKYIEIFNGTGSAVSLSDYYIDKFSNGATSPIGHKVNLSLAGSSLANGAVIVIQASDETWWNGTADISVVYDGSTMTTMGFNGNDPIGLYKNSILIDIVGTPGNTSDHIQNMRLIRKPGYGPATTWNSLDWNQLSAASGSDTSTLGSHTWSVVSSSSSSSSSSSASSGSGGTVFNPSPSDPYYSYYSSAAGLSGAALKAKLKDIIDGHTDRGYDGLYTIYQTSDKTSDGKVWDMYSDRDGTGLNRPYTFSHSSGDRCGQYSVEGDCYNREHVIPQSKFGSSRPMVSDAHHVIPTDGKVNGIRSAYPHGDVSSASKTSQNGSKLGSCANSGYSGTVFEPIDAYKGDIARIYFYFCVRYYNGSISSWGSMNSGAKLKSWAVTAYKAWHNADPVSAKERARNDAIGASSAQGNRNPFIDYPQLVNMIDFTN